MKATMFLIQMSIDQEFYLDGYNGGSEWEFTPDRDRAWPMTLNEAERKLAQLKEIFPDALISER